MSPSYSILKRILIISTNKTITPYPVPPIGPGILAQILKENYKVELVDGLELSKEQLRRKIESFKPDFIGVSIRNIDDMVMDDGRSFIPDIQENFIDIIHAATDAPLILGGSGFSIFPDELMKLFSADYGIIGEAEKSLPLLLQALCNSSETSRIKGVITKDYPANDEQDFVSLCSSFSSDLDTLTPYTPYKERGAYPIQTKRGCCHRCIYCSYPILEGRKFRIRSISHIVDEIERTAQRINDPNLIFEFVDSTFNDPAGHAEEICREIIRRNLNLKLRTMGMNPVNISDELLLLMKQAGFSQIDSTPDSASPTILKSYGKNFSLTQLKNAALAIKRQKMPTMWFFILGGPKETVETIQESFEFIDDFIHPEDMVLITEGLRIYPKTPLAKLAIEDGIIDKNQSLLKPTFYISQHLTEGKLEETVTAELKNRPNCVRLTETKPPPELLQEALKERKMNNLQEPMFRTLLRLKRERFTP